MSKVSGQAKSDTIDEREFLLKKLELRQFLQKKSAKILLGPSMINLKPPLNPNFKLPKCWSFSVEFTKISNRGANIKMRPISVTSNKSCSQFGFISDLCEKI